MGDVMEQKPIILRMRRFGPSKNLFKRIRYKEFLWDVRLRLGRNRALSYTLTLCERLADAGYAKAATATGCWLASSWRRRLIRSIGGVETETRGKEQNASSAPSP